MAKPFDSERCIRDYKAVVATREAAIAAAEGAFQRESKRLRDAWKAWQGEGNLHEMCFGEYIESDE